MQNNFIEKPIILVFIAFFVIAPFGFGQTVNDILARHEMAGGLNSRQKIRTLTSIGKITQMGNTLPISIIQKRPNKYRFDVHLDEGRITQAYDGMFGWIFNPFATPDTLPLEGPELAQIRESADFDGILHSYRQKGFTIQLFGKVNVGSQNAYKIQIKKPNGEIMNFYLDVNTFLVIKSDVGLLINGMPYVAESFFGDFRKVGGMVLPYFIQTRNGTMLTEIKIDTVRINETMEDYYFQWKRSK
jgi:outer membrane lipoprotein-sorting protein